MKRAPLSLKRLDGPRISLEPISPIHITERYLSWLNDPQINRYLECRHESQSFESIRKFVEDRMGKHDRCMFALISVADNKFIGTITLGPILWEHQRAEIGIMIGETTEFGKGFASQAIKLLCDYAFYDLGLNKITAGCYSINQGSIRAFQKAGFSIEATLSRHCRYQGNFIDCVMLSLVKAETM